MSLKTLLVQNIVSALLQSGVIERLVADDIALIEGAIQYANKRISGGNVNITVDRSSGPVPTLQPATPPASNTAPVGGATVDTQMPQGSRPGVDAVTSDAATLIPGIPSATEDTSVVLDARDEDQGELLPTAPPVGPDGVPPPGAPDYRTLSTVKG